MFQLILLKRIHQMGKSVCVGGGVKIKMCYYVYKQLIIILKKDIKNKFSKTLFCFITVEKFMQTVKCVW